MIAEQRKLYFFFLAGECEGEERLQQQAVCPECGDQHTSARQHSQGRHPDHTRYGFRPNPKSNHSSLHACSMKLSKFSLLFLNPEMSILVIPTLEI